MAKRIVEQLVDDIDGTDGASTIHFGWQGAEYEIDLNSANAAVFEKAMSPYVKVARRVSTRSRTRKPAAANGRTTSREELAEIRAWATANGYTVADRGRIPASVAEAYRTGTPAAAGPTAGAASNPGPVDSTADSSVGRSVDGPAADGSAPDQRQARKQGARKTATKKAPTKSAAKKAPRKKAAAKKTPTKKAASRRESTTQ